MTDPIARQVERVQRLMHAGGIDLVALGPGVYLDWLLGFHPSPDERLSLLLIGRAGAIFVMPALNAADTQARCKLPMVCWTDATGPDRALETAIATATGSLPDIGRMSVDETMRTDFTLALLALFPQAEIVTARTLLGPERMVKTPEEYTKLKASAATADQAMKQAMAALRPGMTEEEVAAIVRASFVHSGAMPVFAIIGAGANGAFPHHHTGPSVIRDGDAVVMDIGGRLEGYFSDMTRMAVIGTMPPDYMKVHDVVEQAVCAALAAARPGVAARVVDEAARNVITRAGYGEYFVHRTGHGLGRTVHEDPYITGTSDTILREGMVFSIEPGIYLPGRFGIRLEEIVFLRADGPEILSVLPRAPFHVTA